MMTGKRFFSLAIFCLTAAFAAAQEPVYRVTPEQPSWSRDSGALSVTAESDGVGRVAHTGEHDWAVRYPESIPVRPGEIYALSCRVKLDGSGDVSTGVILYADKEPTRWVFGGRAVGGTTDWTELQSEFIVPPGTTAIIPRLTGGGAVTVLFADYTLRRTGRLEFLETDERWTLENESLEVTVTARDGRFSITDRRTGRTWNSAVAPNVYPLAASRSDGAIRLKLLDGSNFQEFTGVVRLESDRPELTVTLEPSEKNPRFGGEILWPAPLATCSNDRVVLPLNEGFSYPAAGPNPTPNRLYTYGGHGLCMAFWGVVEDRFDSPGAGYLGIIETPDDAGVAAISFKPDDSGASELFAPGPYWVGQKNAFGYARTVRYCFIAEGGHAALCKRYRQHAQARGLYVPFSEKIKKNPRLADGLDRLRGAANIWCWDKNKLETVAMLQEAGIDRILWSAGGSAEEITAMNAMENVLTSRYDIYQDIMDPSRYPELGGVHTDWVAAAWPNQIILRENGDWQRGWGVTPKDKSKPRISCGVICDSQALPYAEQRISEELKTKPYKARFLDTTVAAPWQQCYSPDHPMTRSESRVWKMKLLALLGERFDLVCGSETGHEASVPYCDFYEGMMSLGPFRVPDSGREIGKIWDEVPERVGLYQVGEAFRLPLWELVYHDCTVSYWYWGDYNNKLPTLWKKRDLFNALYGVPPMYIFTRNWFNERRERFVESWKIAGPVAYKTGRSEMTDHRILTADRSVQKSVFSDGTEVIVNFGENPYTLPDGSTLGAESVWKNF